ncbi:MAG: hypothetical protein ACRDZ5_00300 [Acidimicrobiales bacterium]
MTRGPALVGRAVPSETTPSAEHRKGAPGAQQLRGRKAASTATVVLSFGICIRTSLHLSWG